jgi:hypothetical protein
MSQVAPPVEGLRQMDCSPAVFSFVSFPRKSMDKGPWCCLPYLRG